MVMYRKKSILILFLLLISAYSYTQSIDARALFKQLVKEEYQATDSVMIDIQTDTASIDIIEEGDPSSVSFSIIDYADLNNDSIKDYIIHRTSEGMLGGNAKTNSNITYYIMENDSLIKNEYDILLYAPFSYNIGDNISYDKESKILTIHFTQNFRTYYSEDGLKETTKKFKYQNNNLYEFSYLTDCELGKMKDKSIFKLDLENVDRLLSIDMDNYTEISLETFNRNGLQINAYISGCDNMNLYFNVITKMDGTKTSTILDVLKWLVSNTRYKSLINKAALVIEKLGATANLEDIDSVGLGDNWLFKFNNISVNKKTKDLEFSISFIHNINSKQDENWDITVRQK